MSRKRQTRPQSVDQLLRNPVSIKDVVRKLTPELRRCVRVMPFAGTMVKHPLVNQPVHPFLGEAERLNRSLKDKRAALNRAKRDEAWDDYLWLHERPWRVHALAEVGPLVTDHVQWWSLVAVAWVDSENIWENLADWRTILTSERPERTAMMTIEDEAALAAMPERIQIWRGTRAPDQLGAGLSWTVDRDRALFFARRWGQAEPVLLEARVERSDVIAYISGRSEAELIVLPENVEVISTSTVPVES